MKCLPKTYVFAQIQSVEDIYTVLKESEYRKNGYIYIYFYLPPSIFYNVIGLLIMDKEALRSFKIKQKIS